MAQFATSTRLNIFRMVTSRDPKTAENVIKLSVATNFSVLTEYSFRFYWKRGWQEFCDCWFLHEYFEYISPHHVNTADLDKIIGYIERGHCDHVTDEDTGNSQTTSVHLIHLAVAADNKPVVKFLLGWEKIKTQPRRKTSAAGHSPLSLAILKNCIRVINLTYRVPKEDDYAFGSQVLRDRYGMVLAKRCENGQLKFFDKPGCRTNNLIVRCFFIDAVPSNDIFNHIYRFFDNQNEVATALRYVISTHDSKTALDILQTFSGHVSDFSAALILEAVVWNKPEVLNLILTKGTDKHYIYSSDELLHVCRFLGHHECRAVLEKQPKKKLNVFAKHQKAPATFYVWERSKPPYFQKPYLSTNVPPYTFLLNFYARNSYLYEAERLCLLFRSVSKNGYSPNETDEYGMTCLHYALEHIDDAKDLSEIIKALCRLGCDCNIKDTNGRSALHAALTPHLSPLGVCVPDLPTGARTLRVMKDLLHFNAVPQSTQAAVYFSTELDKNNLLLANEPRSTVTVSVIETETESGNKIEVQMETRRERYIAVSFVAVLLELGFHVDKDAQKNFASLPDQLQQYIIETLSTPTPLQSLCRNAIRHQFPGPMLQRYLEVTNLPQSIVDFVLCKFYLSGSKVITGSDDTFGDTILQDQKPLYHQVKYEKWKHVRCARYSAFNYNEHWYALNEKIRFCDHHN